MESLVLIDGFFTSTLDAYVILIPVPFCAAFCFCYVGGGSCATWSLGLTIAVIDLGVIKAENSSSLCIPIYNYSLEENSLEPCPSSLFVSLRKLFWPLIFF